jgi:hypothetical protein
MFVDVLILWENYRSGPALESQLTIVRLYIATYHKHGVQVFDMQSIADSKVKYSHFHVNWGNVAKYGTTSDIRRGESYYE